MALLPRKTASSITLTVYDWGTTEIFRKREKKNNKNKDFWRSKKETKKKETEKEIIFKKERKEKSPSFIFKNYLKKLLREKS